MSISTRIMTMMMMVVMVVLKMMMMTVLTIVIYLVLYNAVCTPYNKEPGTRFTTTVSLHIFICHDRRVSSQVNEILLWQNDRYARA